MLSASKFGIRSNIFLKIEGILRLCTSSSSREIPITINVKKNEKHSSIESEISKFKALSAFWWDYEGEFKALHSLNKLRIQLIRDGIKDTNISNENASLTKPLSQLKILDIGCGGGILCEPLARLGAFVTGIDAESQSINVAKSHAGKDRRVDSHVIMIMKAHVEATNKELEPENFIVTRQSLYINAVAEQFLSSTSKEYDAIVASEVLEHVGSPRELLDLCNSALKPGGSLFITTINRTHISWLAAIVFAEYIAGIVPKGTHEWNKFVPLEELQETLNFLNCKTKFASGMFYMPLKNEWFWTKNTSVNYAVHAVKI